MTRSSVWQRAEAKGHRVTVNRHVFDPKLGRSYCRFDAECNCGWHRVVRGSAAADKVEGAVRRHLDRALPRVGS